MWRILAGLVASLAIASANASEIVCIPMHPRMIGSVNELPHEVIDSLRSERYSYDPILEIGSPFRSSRGADGEEVEQFRLEAGAVDGDCLMASVKSSVVGKPVQTMIFSRDARGWRLVARWDIELRDWLDKAGAVIRP
jgi:hypothetical protein